MNQHEPTPEQIKKQMEDALHDLKQQPAPAAEPVDDGVPTHELPENLPSPHEVIEEHELAPKA